MTAAPHASRRAAGLAALVLFGLSLVAASWCFWLRLDDYPPWLDYDSAALGIFVNNISYREHYDAVFRDSPKEHNVFRASWAASFLPAMAPVSLVQRALDVPPHEVDRILKAAGILFGVLGTLCAAVVARSGGRSRIDALFLFGVVASVPPFLLYVRTTVPNFLYSYFMFWLGVLCADRYTRGHGRKWIYALGVVLGLYAMVPYVPIVVLPLVALVLAGRRGVVVRSLRDPNVYAAAAVSLALFASLRLLVGTTYEPTYGAWQEKTLPYLASRGGHAISLDYLDPALFPDKVAKLVHQHFWFGRDQLGDRTRSDALWTVPSPQIPWVVLLVFAVFGMWASRRDDSALPFAAVLLGTYGVALTIGFPEGRYMIPAIPALAFFALQGLRAAVSDGRARKLPDADGREGVGRTLEYANVPGGQAGTLAYADVPAGNARALAYAVVLFAMAWSSFALVAGPYRDRIVELWHDRAGAKEAIALIRETVDGDYGVGRELRISWPGMNHEVWLYMQMLANLRVRVYELDSNLARQRGSERLFAAARPDDAQRLTELARLGFRTLGTVTDPVIDRKIEVLVRDP